MGGIRNLLKFLALSMLPEGILQDLKKHYYLHVLKSLPIDHEPDMKLLEHLIKPGDSVIDIGANIGIYTIRMSPLVGRDGCVHSIEPVPLTFDILCSNVRKLGLTNVELIQCAISDTNSSVMVEVPLYKSGGENFYRARVIQHTDNSFQRLVMVDSRTIDSTFDKLRRKISFIKCDVEGHELQCLKGAARVVRDNMPAWLIEISGDPDAPRDKAHEAFKLLTEAGYHAYWFDGVRLQQRRPHERRTNYFFLATKHLSTLEGRVLVSANNL
ncbi:MAG: FkbM family methyltransferase [Candidatus Binatia bacterium]